MKTVVVALCLAIAFSLDASAAVDAKAIMQQAVSNIVKRLSEQSTRTNHVRALASPENYALLKSTKLLDAVNKLALQKQLAEAALADADNSEADRLKWHGNYTGEKIDMENLTATFSHEDGYEVTVKFTKPNVQEEVKTANKRLPKLAMTNGVPAKLAAARARRNAEKATPVVNVTQEIDANRTERPNL